MGVWHTKVHQHVGLYVIIWHFTQHWEEQVHSYVQREDILQNLIFKELYDDGILSHGNIEPDRPANDILKLKRGSCELNRMDGQPAIAALSGRDITSAGHQL